MSDMQHVEAIFVDSCCTSGLKHCLGILLVDCTIVNPLVVCNKCVTMDNHPPFSTDYPVLWVTFKTDGHQWCGEEFMSFGVQKWCFIWQEEQENKAHFYDSCNLVELLCLGRTAPWKHRNKKIKLNSIYILIKESHKSTINNMCLLGSW